MRIQLRESSVSVEQVKVLDKLDGGVNISEAGRH